MTTPKTPARRAAAIAARLGAAAGATALLMAAAPAGQWSTYANARFGYSICYPAAQLTAEPEADNGDGRVFNGADGSSLRVYGSNNARGQTLAKAYAEERARHKSISYQRIKGNWYVLSGRDGDELFYIRSLLANGQFKTFELRYPAAKAATWNPLAARISGCFKG